MAGELDPVRPVHPTWPSRPVPEEGDERKRFPIPSQERDQGGRGSGRPGRGEREVPAGDPEPDPEQPPGNPSDDDPPGHHVDEYA